MTSILVGTRKGSFVVEKRGAGWQPRLLGHAGVGVNYLACAPETGTLWAALGHGHWGAKLSRSDDGGASWRDATQIAYPEGARYLAPPDPGSEADAAVTTKDARLLKLWTIAFAPGGRIFVGTIPGGLFVSRDAGESFELNRGLWDHESRGGNLFDSEGSGTTHWFGTPASEGGEFAPGIHSIAIDPRDAERWLVAISTAGVLETTDGGRSWRSRNRGLLMDYLPDPGAEWGHDPHYVAHCSTQPEHVWQQNHCGVFYSSDGAASWKKVSHAESGVHFGFPIAVDENDGRTAWVVPGKADSQRTTIDGGLFVARTEDGGESWRPQRKGLPQEHAYDVVYRHALDVCEDVLAFGSTTGNLFVSEDRGESWQAVAHHLPPVYSVRFSRRGGPV